MSDVTGADGGLIGAGCVTTTTGGGSVEGAAVAGGGAWVADEDAEGGADCACATRAEPTSVSVKTRAIDEVRKGAPRR